MEIWNLHDFIENGNIYKSFFTILIMKRGKRVVISTVFSGKAIKTAIKKLKPDKLILIVDDPMPKTKEETVKELREKFKEIITIETMKTSLYDIPEIMKKVTQKIDEEFDPENEIILHITEGRKITSLALLFAGYSRKDKVKASYYIEEEEDALLNLPIISFDISENKKKLLQEVEKGNKDIEDLKKKVGIQQSAAYKYIKELKEEGYLKEEPNLEITETGKIISI